MKVIVNTDERTYGHRSWYHAELNNIVKSHEYSRGKSYDTYELKTGWAPTSDSNRYSAYGTVTMRDEEAERFVKYYLETKGYAAAAMMMDFEKKQHEINDEHSKAIAELKGSSA